MENKPSRSLDAESRYRRLESTRSAYIKRAEQCAGLTIPALFPVNGNAETLQTPYQGLGSRGVKHLTNKLVMALLPPNTPFFQLLLSEEVDAEGTKGEVDKALSMMESTIKKEIESSQLRSRLYEAIRQLMVAGNYLLYFGPEGVKGYRLDKYVLKRDGLGRISECIIKEVITPDDIPTSVRDAVLGPTQINPDPEKELNQYTVIRRAGKRFRVYQEIKGVVVPESRGKYSEDTLPWLPLRMIRVDGEDYGRSYVEEHLGDLVSLEKLSQAIVDGSQAAARVVFLIEQGSILTPDAVKKARNMDILRGKKEDVTTIQLDKFHDFRIASETISQINRELSNAFLLNTSVQRNAERVTAEEIRFMAAELEQAIGGVYTLLALELQLPLVSIIMERLKRKGRLPQIKKGDIEPQVLTGIEALGRSQELEKLRVLQSFMQALSPELVQKYTHVDEFVKRIGAALHLDTNDLVKTTEQIKKAEQQEALSQMLQQVSPDLMKQFQGETI
ncbi:portal protein [Microbulbifer epialgicus]|uniref:Portal protein n=1 Tax=Microbulbifer epialgicus TaxID=393907 RepID=A0ABV4P1H8_9GAMM